MRQYYDVTLVCLETIVHDNPHSVAHDAFWNHILASDVILNTYILIF